MNNITITSAPWITIPCLDTSGGNSKYQTFWYHEVGAITHNIMLEAAALKLRCYVITNIPDEANLRIALGLSSQTNLQPYTASPPVSTIASNPPEIPIISGQTSGSVDITYDYTVKTNDPDGDNVYYWIEWGDEANTGWLGPHKSGDEIFTNHTWNEKGSYIIKVKAIDSSGAQSDWATLPVTMPCSHNKSTLQFLELLLFQRFPHALPILRHLLGY